MRHARGQSGFSLLEVVLAIFLASVLVSGLAAAFLGVIRINRMTAEQQRIDHAVNNYTEQLKSVVFEDCQSPAASEAGRIRGIYEASLTPSNGVDLEVTSVEFHDPSSPLNDPNAARWIASGCQTGATSQAQRVTVRGEFRDRERQAQVVVRRR